MPLSLELISAGVHVLVEKPISTSIEDGQKLIEAAREKNVCLLVGHHRRFNPYLLAAKKEVERGGLGTMIAVQGSWCLRKPEEYFGGIGEWRRNGASPSCTGSRQEPLPRFKSNRPVKRLPFESAMTVGGDCMIGHQQSEALDVLHMMVMQDSSRRAGWFRDAFHCAKVSLEDISPVQLGLAPFLTTS